MSANHVVLAAAEVTLTWSGSWCLTRLARLARVDGEVLVVLERLS